MEVAERKATGQQQLRHDQRLEITVCFLCDLRQLTAICLLTLLSNLFSKQRSIKAICNVKQALFLCYSITLQIAKECHFEHSLTHVSSCFVDTYFDETNTVLNTWHSLYPLIIKILRYCACILKVGKLRLRNIKQPFQNDSR